MITKKRNSPGYRNVCKNNEKRILSLRSAIGYLLHNFKDSAMPRQLYSSMKNSRKEPTQKRKGVVAQANRETLRKTVASTPYFNFSKNFSFQVGHTRYRLDRVQRRHRRNYFDKLFSIITDDITVEKKNKDVDHNTVRQSLNHHLDNYTLEDPTIRRLTVSITVEVFRSLQ